MQQQPQHLYRRHHRLQHGPLNTSISVHGAQLFFFFALFMILFLIDVINLFSFCARHPHFIHVKCFNDFAFRPFITQTMGVVVTTVVPSRVDLVPIYMLYIFVFGSCRRIYLLFSSVSTLLSHLPTLGLGHINGQSAGSLRSSACVQCIIKIMITHKHNKINKYRKLFPLALFMCISFIRTNRNKNMKRKEERKKRTTNITTIQ